VIDELRALHTAALSAEAHAEEARTLFRASVRAAHAQGFSYGDIAGWLGLSRGRIEQLVNGTAGQKRRRATRVLPAESGWDRELRLAREAESG